VVDVVIHHVRGQDEDGADVDSVREQQAAPDAAELEGLLLGRAGAAVAPRGAAGGGAPRVAGGRELEEVGEQEVAGDQDVDGQAELDVGFAEVVAFEAD